MLHNDRIDLKEGIDVVKRNNSKECIILTIGILMIGLNFKNLFAMVVIIC